MVKLRDSEHPAQDDGTAALRRRVLDEYSILDTPAESDFDDIVKVASEVCGTPISLISLLDTDRQWFKAKVGFEPSETPIAMAVCAHAVQQDDLFIIPDTTLDSRTAENPLVTGPTQIRFYAGMPLRSPGGLMLGTLCVLDDRPRDLTASQQLILRALARQVMTQLELRRAIQDQQREVAIREESERRLQLALNVARLGQWELALDTGDFAASPVFRAMFGFAPDRVLQAKDVRAAIHPDDTAGVAAAFKTAIATGKDYETEYRIIRPDGSEAWVLVRGQVTPGEARMLGVSLDITARKVIEQRFATSEERLNLALNASGVVGIWDWDLRTGMVYADGNFARLHHVDPGRANIGAPLAAYTGTIHPDDLPVFQAELDRAFAGTGDFSCEYRLLKPDGSVRWALARGGLVHDADGVPVRFPGAAVEITDRKLAEARQAALVELGDRLRDLSDRVSIITAATEIMGRVFTVGSAGFAPVDAMRETIFIEHDWCAPGFASVTGLHAFRDFGSYIDDLKGGETVVVKDISSDRRMAPGQNGAVQHGIGAFVNLPIMEHGRFVALVFLLSATPRDWTHEEITLLRNTGDRIQAAIARVEAEEQQRMLNLELSHRMKNMLSMVQAIANQTMRGAPDMQAAKAVLSSRLVALGRAHDILLGNDGHGLGTTPLRNVIEGALRLHQDGSTRIRIRGPDIAVAAKAGLSISLILHELATNAIKYGALSTDTGRVSVDWSIQNPTTRPAMHLRWVESGGPAVVPPTRKGFGSRLIERGLSSSSQGRVELEYGLDGLTCTIVSTLTDLQAEHGPLKDVDAA